MIDTVVRHSQENNVRLARWVNNKFIFRTCEKFEDYQKGRLIIV